MRMARCFAFVVLSLHWSARVSGLCGWAEGSSMYAFTWNGGGRWLGKPWNVELPTDSALLLYLFGAFLEAPRWQFAVGGPATQAPLGAPLFLGTLPTRPPEFYFALLPVRPAAMSKVRSSASSSCVADYVRLVGGWRHEVPLGSCSVGMFLPCVVTFLQPRGG
jgi:Cytochrome B561, N terminal